MFRGNFQQGQVRLVELWLPIKTSALQVSHLRPTAALVLSTSQLHAVMPNLSAAGGSILALLCPQHTSIKEPYQITKVTGAFKGPARDMAQRCILISSVYQTYLKQQCVKHIGASPAADKSGAYTGPGAPNPYMPPPLPNTGQQPHIPQNFAPTGRKKALICACNYGCLSLSPKTVASICALFEAVRRALAGLCALGRFSDLVIFKHGCSAAPVPQHVACLSMHIALEKLPDSGIF